jgi:hypothetical protein
VVCRALPPTASGWAGKFHALLSSQFEDALFLDADNFAGGTDPAHRVFLSDSYKRTGAVLWPDLWGLNCSNNNNYDSNNIRFG